MFRSVAHTVPLLVVLTLSPIEVVRPAAPDTQPPSVALHYRSTDLDTPRGIALLHRRIRSAASSVCGAYDRALAEEKAQWDECVDQAVSRTVAAVHSETLSAYHGRWAHADKRQPVRSFAFQRAPDVQSSTKH
jgi:UrcA family protein